jgi:alkanesulfonate monooxygenase SsuD/methylene tetrahydromethanopterin reductase-like flavin-dependent oxidoreductase (luciferase family)
MATKRGARGPAALTQEQWMQQYERVRDLNDKLRAENRRIESALARVLQTRREMRESLGAELRAAVERYEEFGTPESVAERLDQLDEYRELGSPKDLKKVLEERDEYEEFVGTLTEAKSAARKLAQYEEFGTPEDIERRFAAMLDAMGIDEHEWRRRSWRYGD